jgi:FkbM family methyltransferase
MNKLEQALATLGKDETFRANLIEALVAVEGRLAELDFDVREIVTGPIVDALHEQDESLKKLLDSGINFNFRYRSKIARDFVMSKENVPDHVWEPQTTRLLLHLGQSVHDAVIGGAYCGDQAILLAHSIQNSGGTCHCFEPNQDQMKMLRLNGESNGLKNLRFNQLGVWNQDDSSLVLVGDDSFAHAEEVEGNSEQSFKTITINTYAQHHGIKKIGLIMLDIEGAELNALKGASTYLAQEKSEAPNVVFEIHSEYVDWSNGLENTEIGQLLTGYGYSLYCVRDYQSNEPMKDGLIELIPAKDTYLKGPPHGFNMLATKNPELLFSDVGKFRIVTHVSPKYLRHRNPKLHQPLINN